MKRETEAKKATYIVVDSGAKSLLLPSVHGLTDVARPEHEFNPTKLPRMYISIIISSKVESIVWPSTLDHNEIDQ